MTEFTNELATTATTEIIFTSALNIKSVISAIRLSVPNDCSVALRKYNSVTQTLVTMYTLTLDAGDIVIDDFKYVLEGGEYLQLVGSITNITYTISGIKHQ